MAKGREESHPHPAPSLVAVLRTKPVRARRIPVETTRRKVGPTDFLAGRTYRLRLRVVDPWLSRPSHPPLTYSHEILRQRNYVRRGSRSLHLSAIIARRHLLPTTALPAGTAPSTAAAWTLGSEGCPCSSLAHKRSVVGAGAAETSIDVGLSHSRMAVSHVGWSSTNRASSVLNWLLSWSASSSEADEPSGTLPYPEPRTDLGMTSDREYFAGPRSVRGSGCYSVFQIPRRLHPLQLRQRG